MNAINRADAAAAKAPRKRTIEEAREELKIAIVDSEIAELSHQSALKRNKAVAEAGLISIAVESSEPLDALRVEILKSIRSGA